MDKSKMYPLGTFAFFICKAFDVNNHLVTGDMKYSEDNTPLQEALKPVFGKMSQDNVSVTEVTINGIEMSKRGLENMKKWSGLTIWV